MVSTNEQTIGKAKDLYSLIVVPTQVTFRGNVGSMDGPILAQPFTFGPRGRVMH